MYSKEEAREIRIAFWSKLEQEMEKIRNPHGSKVNWMHYNTGFNDLYFRMEADESGARLCIDIQFNDPGIRELYYNQFEEFEKMLTDIFKDKLKWLPEFEHSNGKTIARLAIEQEGTTISKRQDWDKMHLFLKLNFKKLDEFWTEFGDVFRQLK